MACRDVPHAVQPNPFKRFAVFTAQDDIEATSLKTTIEANGHARSAISPPTMVPHSDELRPLGPKHGGLWADRPLARKAARSRCSLREHSAGAAHVKR